MKSKIWLLAGILLIFLSTPLSFLHAGFDADGIPDAEEEKLLDTLVEDTRPGEFSETAPFDTEPIQGDVGEYLVNNTRPPAKKAEAEKKEIHSKEQV